MHKENMLAMPPSGAVQCRVVLWTLTFCNSLMIIGKLLGHTQVKTTDGCAHLAQDSMQTAASCIKESIGADLLTGDSDQNVAKRNLQVRKPSYPFDRGPLFPIIVKASLLEFRKCV